MTEQQAAPEGAVTVGVDGSEKDGLAVDWAADEAERRGSPLHVMYAFPWLTSAREHGARATPDVARMGGKITGAAASRARARHHDLEVTTAVVMEDAAPALVTASERASMVVLGARGLGRIAGRLLGSVSQKVAAHAHSPVVVVRHVPPEGPVVVGVDRPADSVDALQFAFAQAVRRGVGVRVVHAEGYERPRQEYLDPRVDAMLEEAAEAHVREVRRDVEEWARRYSSVEVEVRQEQQHPVEALTAAAAEGCLVVVGSRDRGGLPAVRLGSVSRGVLHEAPVVAVVPIRSAR
jgi:nucleotide-binding universal stress UspA family protein